MSTPAPPKTAAVPALPLRAVHSAFASAAAGAGAGLLLAVADIASVHVSYGPNLDHGVERWVFLLGAIGVLTVVGAVLGLLVALWGGLAALIGSRVSRGWLARGLAGLLSALPLVAATHVLNANIAEKAPLVHGGLLLLVAGAVAAIVALRFPPRGESWPPARTLSPVVALGTGAAAYWADTHLFVGLYPGQHVSLAIAYALAALWLAHEALVRLPRLGRWLRAGLVALAILGSAVLLSLRSGDVSQNVRYLSFDVAPAERHALGLLTRVTDWDGDGVASLLGGGDCDGRDPDVHPGAAERPDNGKDDDCLGGDLDAAARALYEERTAVPPPPAPPVPEPPARHLVVITLDAVRYDRYAERPELTPRLNELASRAVRFRRMYVPYPSTILSLYSIMAGVYPSEVTLTPYHQWEVPSRDPRPTLAEILRERSFRTGGFWFHHIIAPELGIGRGFDTYWVADNTPEVVDHTISGAEAVDRALRWLDTVDASAQRVFLWVHLYDPHAPYEAHPDFDFGDGDEARYDAEVAYTDREMGRLLDELDRRGRLADSVVWVFADHGEEFGEHGGRFHATSLYEELVHVPAFVLAPGLAPWDIDVPTSLIDLGPTALDMLGLSGAFDPTTARGRSLARLAGGQEAPLRLVFLECFRADGDVLRAVVDGPWKLVHSRDDHFLELYNLDYDAPETRNVFDLLPAESSRLEKLIGAWVGGVLGG